jgi:ATP-dependent Clp protease protease subunit
METKGAEANINIYGDITSWPWQEGDTSAANLSQQLDALGDVSRINVFINSYGGEVAEGLAIYNALKRHKAKVVTWCDGFAASIASVIFMAGDERIMNESSLLMVHNAWTWGEGNAEQLRKQADDLDKITEASIAAYKAHSTLSEDEIRALLDAETWILPSEALEYGFATRVEKIEVKNTSQSARTNLFALVKAMRQQAEDEDVDDDEAGDEKTDEDDSEQAGDDETHVEDPGDGKPAKNASENDDEDSDGEDSDDEDSENENPETDKNNASQKWIGLFEKFKKI